MPVGSRAEEALLLPDFARTSHVFSCAFSADKWSPREVHKYVVAKCLLLLTILHLRGYSFSED